MTELLEHERQRPGDLFRLALAPAELRGRWIGDYRLIRRLGEGGMGVVYEAEQQHPLRRVALKQIRGGAFVSASSLRQFDREVQALARLKHPDVAAIYDSGQTDDGEPFFVMELVDGEPLTAFARRRRVETEDPTIELLRVFLRVCDAVSYAHQHGVIHRDMKPANILVVSAESASQTGNAERAAIKVLDFGLARVTDADLTTGSMVTEIGRVQGTLAYMSPEQLRGNSEDIDLRTDVYALGVVLCELVTDSLPYPVDGLSLVEAARTIDGQDPQFRHSSLPRDLTAVLAKALEKDPDRRYQSVAALADDLERYLRGEPVSARPPTSFDQVRRLVARHKLPAAFIGVIAVLLTALAITMSVESARLSRERDRERAQAEASRRVVDFMVSLFNVSDPSEARGSTITAREVLDRGAARLATGLEDDPAVRATLQYTEGRVYSSLGLWKPSRELLLAALAARQKQFGSQSLEAAQALYALADIDTFGGITTIAEAARWSREALAIRRRLLGGDDLDLAASLRQAGAKMAAVSRDPTGEGERLIEESLAIRQRRLGGDNAQVADSLDALGLAISYAERDLVRGEPYLIRALAMHRRVQGNDHPATISAIQALANHYARKSDLGRAEPLYREEIKTSRHVLGSMHPTVALVLNDLLNVLIWEGKFVDADLTGREALGIVHGKYPTIETTVLSNLALNSRCTGDMRTAETRWREALTTADVGQRPSLLISLAALLNETGQHAEALALANESIAIARQIAERRAGRTAGTPSADALAEQAEALRPSNPAAAVRAYSQAAELARARISDVKRTTNDARSLAMANALLGQCLVALDRPGDAEPLLASSEDYFRSALGEKHMLTQRVHRLLVLARTTRQ
jgi:serine/threonine protein kinase